MSHTVLSAHLAQPKTYQSIDLGSEPEVVALRTIADLQSVSAFWRKYQVHIDHDYDSYVESITASKGEEEPYVLANRRNGETTHLLIGRRLKKIPDWRIGYRKVLTHPADCIEFPYAGFLGKDCDSVSSGDVAKAMIFRLLQSLKSGDADYAWLPYLPVDSPLYRAVETTLPRLSRDPVRESVPHRTLLLPETYEEFYQARSKRTRSDMRHYKNKITKKFGDGAYISCFTQPDEMQHAHSCVKKVYEATWQYRLGTLTLEHDCIVDEWTARAQKGQMLVYVLFFNDKPVAFATGHLYNKTFDFKLTGFDETESYYHPGTYLLLEIIKRFCEDERFQILDFGYSDEEYKKRFGSTQWDEESLAIFAPGIRGMRLLLARVTLSGGTKLAKWSMSKLGDYRKLRKRLRKSTIMSNRTK